jgi:hypothetical protein
MKRVLLLALAIGALGLLACGGSTANPTPSPSPERILHLSSGNISETDFRTQTRGALLESNSQAFCAGLAGLSDQQAVDAVVKAQGAPVTPVQEADAADLADAASIVKDECSRIIPSP